METINTVSEIHCWNSGDGEPQANGLSDSAYYSEPGLDATDAVPVYSVVKWFNPKRGFGFVVLSDGSGEAFLHRKILAQFGIDTVKPCAVLKVRVMRGNSGLKIVEVLSVDSSAVAPTSRYQKARPGQRTTPEAGTVSLWRADKGYGFIARDGGGSDAFFRVSWLKRQRVFRLSEGQRVVMDVVERGPEATNIRLMLPTSRQEDQSNE
jgi:cold shock protein